MSRAAKMIEYSNNKAAESLWVKIGQLPSVTEFNDDIHFTQTLMNWDWGLIDTTPRDQLNLLKSILLPNSYLDTASQAYEQDLMENVVDYERFGIPTGVPTNATVGVKNGWYLEKATGWQVNTAGYVHLGRTYYLAVVMTASNRARITGEKSSIECPRRSGTSNRVAPVPRWSSRRCRRFVGIFLGEGHERVSKRRPAFGQSQRYDGGPTSTIRLAIGALDLQFVKSSVKERFRGPARFSLRLRHCVALNGGDGDFADRLTEINRPEDELERIQGRRSRGQAEVDQRCDTRRRLAWR